MKIIDTNETVLSVFESIFQCWDSCGLHFIFPSIFDRT